MSGSSSQVILIKNIRGYGSVDIPVDIPYEGYQLLIF